MPSPQPASTAAPTFCLLSTCRALVLTAGSAPSAGGWRPVHPGHGDAGVAGQSTPQICVCRDGAPGRRAVRLSLAGVVDAQYAWPWVPRRRAPWKACSLPASGAAQGLSSPRCTVQAFFTRWWAQQDEDMRAAVSQLVRSGQASGSVFERAASQGVVMRQCFHLCMCGAICCRCTCLSLPGPRLGNPFSPGCAPA